MRRYDVRRFKPEPLSGHNPYVLVVQARGLGEMRTAIVAPLERVKRARKLNEFELEIGIEGEPFRILMQELAAQPKRDIGEKVADARHLEWQISRALDLLLFGV